MAHDPEFHLETTPNDGTEFHPQVKYCCSQDMNPNADCCDCFSVSRLSAKQPNETKNMCRHSCGDLFLAQEYQVVRGEVPQP